VLDDAVRVEIDLPWAMQLLRDTIARRVCSRGWLCWIGRPKRSYSSSLQMIMDPIGAERTKLRDAYLAEFMF
jgi:hypothetical protein